MPRKRKIPSTVIIDDSDSSDVEFVNCIASKKVKSYNKNSTTEEPKQNMLIADNSNISTLKNNTCGQLYMPLVSTEYSVSQSNEFSAVITKSLQEQQNKLGSKTSEYKSSGDLNILDSENITKNNFIAHNKNNERSNIKEEMNMSNKNQDDNFLEIERISDESENLIINDIEGFGFNEDNSVSVGCSDAEIQNKPGISNYLIIKNEHVDRNGKDNEISETNTEIENNTCILSDLIVNRNEYVDGSGKDNDEVSETNTEIENSPGISSDLIVNRNEHVERSGKDNDKISETKTEIENNPGISCDLIVNRNEYIDRSVKDNDEISETNTEIGNNPGISSDLIVNRNERVDKSGKDNKISETNTENQNILELSKIACTTENLITSENESNGKKSLEENSETENALEVLRILNGIENLTNKISDINNLGGKSNQTLFVRIEDVEQNENASNVNKANTQKAKTEATKIADTPNIPVDTNEKQIEAYENEEIIYAPDSSIEPVKEGRGTDKNEKDVNSTQTKSKFNISITKDIKSTQTKSKINISITTINSSNTTEMTQMSDDSSQQRDVNLTEANSSDNSSDKSSNTTAGIQISDGCNEEGDTDLTEANSNDNSSDKDNLQEQDTNCDKSLPRSTDNTENALESKTSEGDENEENRPEELHGNRVNIGVCTRELDEKLNKAGIYEWKSKVSTNQGCNFNKQSSDKNDSQINDTNNTRSCGTQTESYSYLWGHILSALDDPSYLVKYDKDVIILRERQPKARFHYLIIPRENVRSLNELTLNHLSLLEYMEEEAKQLISLPYHSGETFKVGYIGQPTMFLLRSQKFLWLHMHVISKTPNLSHLTQKKHWNLLHSELFMESKDVRCMLEDCGSVEVPTPEECKLFLQDDVKCSLCNFQGKNLKLLINHLQKKHKL